MYSSDPIELLLSISIFMWLNFNFKCIESFTFWRDNHTISKLRKHDNQLRGMHTNKIHSYVRRQIPAGFRHLKKPS